MPRPNSGPRLVWLKKRKCWYIRTCEHGRTRDYSTGTIDRPEAEAALAQFITSRYRTNTINGPRHPSQFSIVEALQLYADEHGASVANPARIGYAMDALLTFWENLSIGDISEQTCKEYGRQRGRAPGTIRRELGVLRAAINFAFRYGRLTSAPHVFLPQRPEGKTRWLTRSEAARLLNVARISRSDTRLYMPLFIVLALYTGARKEALLSLQWRQVNLDERRIDLNPPGRKRTNKGRAVLPIPNRLFTFLRLAKRRGSEFGYVIHKDGARLGDIKKSFARICLDAGLTGVTPHTLRHTCGTWLAQSGVDLWQVAGWLGQTHARTTELYAHHHPDHLAAAMEAIDRRRA